MNRTNQFSLSILCFFICFLLAMSGIRARDEALAADIAPKILRFHVLANSDSRTDQAVKMEVRDAVLSYLKEVLPEELDVKETTRWMRGHTEEIRQVAEQKMADLQMQQTVSVAVTTCYFPDRTYGDVTFPAGNYKTLRIELGDAAGHNWWCVVFPPLCAETTSSLSQTAMAAGLTEEEVALITESDGYQLKFKAVELWEKLMAYFR